MLGSGSSSRRIAGPVRAAIGAALVAMVVSSTAAASSPEPPGEAEPEAPETPAAPNPGEPEPTQPEPTAPEPPAPTEPEPTEPEPEPTEPEPTLEPPEPEPIEPEAPQPEPEPDPEPLASANVSDGCTVDRELKSGSQGKRVKCLESRLQELGFFEPKFPDGTWNVKTWQAVGAFQRSIGLISTGRADPYTLKKMGIWAGGPTPFPCSVSSPVGPSTTGPRVACVESRLKMMGHFEPKFPDGTWNSKTAQAVRAFQRRVGLLPTGVADGFTLRKMGIWSGGATPFPCTVAGPVGRKSTGHRVRCLESRLTILGYSVKGPNGTFDDSTAAAVRAWERKRGLIADQTANAYTLWRMGIWRSGKPKFPCSVAKGIGTSTVAKRVKCVESRLRDLGYSLNGPNKKVDATTVAAVRAYQSANGLTVDGIAGPYTLVSLGIWSGPPPEEVLPRGSGTGRRIVYDKSRMRVWMVEANGKVAKTHRVSGNSQWNNPLPGNYSVYSKSSYTCAIENPHVCWRYMTRFAYGPNGGRIGFHEIPTDIRTGRKLQSIEQLGQSLSAGCVRQSTPDAVYLWNWAPVGTKVVVLQ